MLNTFLNDSYDTFTRILVLTEKLKDVYINAKNEKEIAYFKLIMKCSEQDNSSDLMSEFLRINNMNTDSDGDIIKFMTEIIELSSRMNIISKRYIDILEEEHENKKKEGRPGK